MKYYDITLDYFYLKQKFILNGMEPMKGWVEGRYTISKSVKRGVYWIWITENYTLLGYVRYSWWRYSIALDHYLLNRKEYLYKTKTIHEAAMLLEAYHKFD